MFPIVVFVYLVYQELQWRSLLLNRAEAGSFQQVIPYPNENVIEQKEFIYCIQKEKSKTKKKRIKK